jgi:tetratricopeptide (TPR) repeat protein
MSARLISIAMLVIISSVRAAGAQTLPTDTVSHTARQRAEPQYKVGLDCMRREDYPGALKAFETAVEIDPAFELAYYMMGRAHLALRSYAAAVQALSHARHLYTSLGTTQFTDEQQRERYRRDRLNTLAATLDSYRSITPQTPPIREAIRQLEEQRRQVEDMDRARSQSQAPAVPAFVSLSLGSAYFRSGRLAEAEKAYLDAVAADPKSGEAFSNLAVVYLTTGRYQDADRAVKAAEKAGFKVHPELKEDIRKRIG